MDAWLLFVLLGAVLIVLELGALLPPRWADGPSRRRWRLVTGALYAVIASLFVLWWFGSDSAGSLLSVVLLVLAPCAAIIVAKAIALAARGGHGWLGSRR
jgi:hypothetical protein